MLKKRLCFLNLYENHFYILVLFLLFVFLTPKPLFADAINNSISSIERKNKILVLIIASDDPPFYTKLQEIWRAYMHLDPTHIEAYFIKSNPNLPVNTQLIEDVIWSKTEENLIPGLLNKTISSLEFMQERLIEFDYVLRTNLSSFYNFPQLLNFVKTLPIENCYYGFLWNHRVHGIFAQGDGIIISTDLAYALIAAKEELWNDSIVDDVRIGMFFSEKNILAKGGKRVVFPTLLDFITKKDKIPSNIFQFRVKNEENKRDTDEITIQMNLLKMFYNIDL